MRPPRLEYNAKLTAETITKYHMTSRFEKVSEQLPVLALEPGKLVRFGYNPTLIEEDGHLTMAYRYHEGIAKSTRLALAQIDFNGNVINNRAVPIGELSMEDPKLYRYQNELYMAWVEATYPNLPLKSVVKYGKLVEGEIRDVHQPKLPGNDFSTMQKN